MRNGNDGSWTRSSRAGLEHWRTMPVAITVETELGDVGLVHAGTCLKKLARDAGRDREGGPRGDLDCALRWLRRGWSNAWRGPAGAPIEGVRAVVTGHIPRQLVEHDGPWWCIDTGAGMKQPGRLSLLRIDCEPMEAITVDVVSEERQGSNHAGRTSDPPPPTCMHMTFLHLPMQWRRPYQGFLEFLFVS